MSKEPNQYPPEAQHLADQLDHLGYTLTKINPNTPQNPFIVTSNDIFAHQTPMDCGITYEDGGYKVTFLLDGPVPVGRVDEVLDAYDRAREAIKLMSATDATGWPEWRII